jgi:hypothetical protein
LALSKCRSADNRQQGEVMAKAKSDGVRGLPANVKAALAKNLVGASLETYGKVFLFPIGVPVDDWVVSVLPKSPRDARTILDQLNLRPGTRYEVFPYGIINPEIGRIDVRFTAGR